MSQFAVDLVKKFWALMATNDFQSVGSVLSDDFVLEWPQSGERIRGRANYAVMNEQYPTTTGRWTFSVNRLVGNDHGAVSDVSVSDGVQNARAISFFELRDGKIVKMVEYWPEPFVPRDERTHLVEQIDGHNNRPRAMRRFDSKALYEMLDEKRQERALSWDRVAQEIGVSKSTILRTKIGGRMEVDGMLAMVAWLGMPVERFVRDGDSFNIQ